MLTAARTRPLLWSCTAPSLRRVGCAVRRANSAVAATSTGSLPKAAASGRQPDALFRRHAARLGGDGGGVGDAGEGELPFPSIPHPDYEAERPQEQTAPEPDNPLPEGLPPNHPQEEPKGPEPEVPLPRRDEPDANPLFPPDIVPTPGPQEAPPLGRPTEVPGAPSPPEFQPNRAPSEMPDRGGGSEINFP